MSLRSGFRSRFIIHLLLVLFPNRLDRRIYETKFPTYVSFIFPLSVCRITVTFPSTLKPFFLFVTVTILSRYQSPLNSRSRNVRTTLLPKWITVTLVDLQAYYLCSCLKCRGFALSKTKGCLNSQNSLLLDNIGKDDWQHRFIRGRFSYVCRIKQGWINVPNGELVGTTECRSF